MVMLPLSLIFFRVPSCAAAGAATARAASAANARPKAGVMLFSLRCVEFAPGILTPSRAPGHGPHALGHRREQRGRELGPGLHQVQEHLAVERGQTPIPRPPPPPPPPRAPGGGRRAANPGPAFPRLRNPWGLGREQRPPGPGGPLL